MKKRIDEYNQFTRLGRSGSKSIPSTLKKEWMSIIKFQDLAGREVEVYAVREKEN